MGKSDTHTLSHSLTQAPSHTDYRRPYIHTIWIVKVHRWGIIQLGGFCVFPSPTLPSRLLCFILSASLLSLPSPPPITSAALSGLQLRSEDRL